MELPLWKLVEIIEIIERFQRHLIKSFDDEKFPLETLKVGKKVN